MSLRSQLLDDLKTAMKARDQLKLDTIRFVLSKMKNDEIDLKRELTDEEISKLLKKEVKNREEAIAQFKQGGRDEIVEEETAKVDVIKAYLPAEMSDEQLETIVKETLAENEGANFGQVMQAVMKKVQGQADGSRVSGMVKMFSK